MQTIAYAVKTRNALFGFIQCCSVIVKLKVEQEFSSTSKKEEC